MLKSNATLGGREGGEGGEGGVRDEGGGEGGYGDGGTGPGGGHATRLEQGLLQAEYGGQGPVHVDARVGAGRVQRAQVTWVELARGLPGHTGTILRDGQITW